MEQHHIHHKKSTPYHPRDNEKVEVTNKELENNLIKAINMRKKPWVDKFTEEAWAYNTK